MTVLAFERYPVDPDSEDRFRDAVDAHLALLRSGGALWADAARAFDDPPSYIVVSEWRTAADLDAWEQGGRAREFRDGCDALLRGEVTRRRFSAGT